ncbi:26181_t:CDS:2, partial [Racocetra persica]
DFDMISDISTNILSGIYEGIWIDGPRLAYNEEEDMWVRDGPTKVFLKKFDVSQEFLNQLENHFDLLLGGPLADYWGITKDNTGNFMFVMKHYSAGNLYEFLDNKGKII